MTVSQEALGIQFSSEDTAVVLDLRGDLDTYAASELRQHLVDVIDGQGNMSVTLRLDGVTFVDSTALGVLIGAHRRIRARGGMLRIESPPGPVLKVFEVTGLTRELHVTRR